LFVYQRVTYSKNIKRSHEEEILPVELWHVCQSLADLHHRCQTWIFMGIRFAYHLVIFPGHGKHMKIPMTSTYVLVLMFPTYHVYIILYIIIHIHISICMCVLCARQLCVCLFSLVVRNFPLHKDLLGTGCRPCARYLLVIFTHQTDMTL
jgi:hypothetical protein